MALSYIALGLCFALGQSQQDMSALLQGAKIQVHDHEEPKPQNNVALRQYIKNLQLPGMPGGLNLPADMPEIKMDEVMNLLPLVPELIKGVTKELPAVVDAGHMLEVATKEDKKTILKGVNASSEVDDVMRLVHNNVITFGKMWVMFTGSLIKGLRAALGPIIAKAEKKVSFIPPNATNLLMGMVETALKNSGMSGLMQLPVAAPGKEGLILVNRNAEKYWNMTNGSMKNAKGMLTKEGSVLDMLKNIPLGVNITAVVAELKPQVIKVLDYIDGANNNMVFGIHEATEKSGVDWRHVEKSGSAGVRVGFGFLLALAFAAFLH